MVVALLVLGVGSLTTWWSRHRLPEQADRLLSPVATAKNGATTASLTPETQAVLQLQGGYLATLGRLEKCSRGLPALDCEQLREWAAGPQPTDIKDAAQWTSLVNEVFNVLRRQKRPVELVDAFATMIADPARPAALRDYAVQHLGSWLRHEGFQKPEAASRRQHGIEILLTAASGNELFRGTAMHALCDLAAECPGLIDPERMDEMLVRGVLDDRGEMAGRITLLQLAAQRKLKAVLPTARIVAADEASRISLRLSAIACLGQIGEADDRLLLQNLSRAASGDSAARLLPALEPALARLNEAWADPVPR